jgi:hypothetical protein
MIIPKFEDDRFAFVKFVQTNKGIIDALLLVGDKYKDGGKYRLTSDVGAANKLITKNVYAGYYFLRNDLDDDANLGTLLDESDEDNDEDIHIIKAFEQWLNKDIVKQKFKKEYNESLRKDINLKRDKIDETREARQRVVGRTNQIKDELLDIDYVLDNREKSVKGKKYRTAKRSYITNEVKNLSSKKRGGKRNKTKKNRMRTK